MMNFQRMIYTDAPAAIEVPPELRHRQVEVIMLALDNGPAPTNGKAVDERGWPVDFFAETAGRWEGEPLLREQP